MIVKLEKTVISTGTIFNFTIATAFVGGMFFASLSHDKSSDYMNDLAASQGSITSCIELDAIANEIEITDSAMIKATSKVLGFIPGLNADIEESPKYCALKLA